MSRYLKVLAMSGNKPFETDSNCEVYFFHL
jgi:hypothetical protein